MSTGPRLREVTLPDLGLEHVRASVWLVDAGGWVAEGDRLLEVVANNITVDVGAPASGRLLEQRVSEGQSLQTGQLLGVIEEDDG